MVKSSAIRFVIFFDRIKWIFKSLNMCDVPMTYHKVRNHNLCHFKLGQLIILNISRTNDYNKILIYFD